MNFTEIAKADASIEAKVEAISAVLDKKLDSLVNTVTNVSQQVGPKGDKGDRGLSGKDGKDGINGKDGRNGSDGKDGIDGSDGEDGVGVTNARVEFDGSLVITLSDGNEIDVGDVVGTDGKDGRDGINGIGLVSGGLTGQMLIKKSDQDFDNMWEYPWRPAVGSFYDTTDQHATVNTATAFSCNSTDISSGVSVVDSTKFTVSKKNIYNLQFSAQFFNDDSASHEISIWLVKNGAIVPTTCTDVTLPSKHGSNKGALVAAWNFFVDLNANDYVQLYWSTPSNLIYLAYLGTRTTPDRPSVPSIILTMNEVDGNNVY